jgi:hypothetical protein
MLKFKNVLAALFFLFVGVVIGGYLFSESQPRSFLSLNRCQNCMEMKELAGLLASVGIQKIPGVIPSVVFETPKTIVVKNPIPESEVDYVIFPKKDIKSIGEISEEDAPFLMDAYLAARHLIEKEKLSRYRILTNGPGFQDVSYLHFHLIGK